MALGIRIGLVQLVDEWLFVSDDEQSTVEHVDQIPLVTQFLYVLVLEGLPQYPKRRTLEAFRYLARPERF